MTGTRRGPLYALLFDVLVIFAFITAVVLGGLVSGRALTAGRADAVDWASALVVVSAILAFGGWLLRWRRWRMVLLWAMMGAVVAIFVFCWIGAGNGPFPDVWHSREMDPRVRGDDEVGGLDVGVITALDVVWQPDGSVPPLIQALGGGIRLSSVSAIDDAGLKRFDRLLIAQPRLLQPEELVAIDAWVRRGGRALIFADPWLLWPSDLRPGDRRGPPLTSLLDPLLSHWGLTLEPADLRAGGVERRFLSGGALMPVAAASTFRASGTACVTAEAGLMALCRIGRGRVRLVADADLLDERLWLADSPAGANRRAWAGDTPALVRDWIADPLIHPGKSGIPWIRDDKALIDAVRWALLFGMAWAMLGAGGIRCWMGAEGAGRRWDRPGDGKTSAGNTERR